MFDSVPKALASWTGAVRVIKAEEARLRLGVNCAVILTFKPVRKLQALWFSFSSLNIRRAMSLLKTDFQGIDQALSDIRSGDESIDHHNDVCESIHLVIVRGVEINSLPGGVQTSEASLHEAHDVRGHHLTRRRGGTGTRRSFSLLRRFSASPHPRVAAFLSLRFSVSLRLSQSGLRWKEDVKTRPRRKRPQNFVGHGFR